MSGARAATARLKCARALGMVTCLALTPISATAHQLDEYLQAARLGLSRQGIVVDLSLTPGVLIASTVLAAIDRDGDAVLTPAELDAYAAAALREMLLTVDGREVTITLRRATAPALEAMREGTGIIRVEAVAGGPLEWGSHHIVFENRHQPAPSAYLANALKPESKDITIGRQQRDPLQRRFELDVDVAGTREKIGVTVAGFALIAGLVVWRRRVRR